MPLLYRTMRADEEGLPTVGRAPFNLGVQVSGPFKDVTVLDDGTILAEKGGMSVFVDPKKMPKSLRPRGLTEKPGESPFPIFALEESVLPAALTFRRDRGHHGLVEPRATIKLEDFEDQLGATRPEWTISHAAT